MANLKTRFLCAILAISSTIALFPGMEAFANEEISASDEMQSYADFIEFSLPRHIQAQGMITSNTVKYSNPVPFYNFGDNSLVGSEVFIIDDNEVIGRLRVYGDGEDITSDFDTSVTNEMTDSYLSGSEIAMGYLEGSVWLYSSDEGFSYVDGYDNSGSPNVTPDCTEPITVAGDVSVSRAMPRSIMTYNLPVSHVANSRKHNKLGQCWASCVAMIVNYRKGTSLTSDGVYDDLEDAGIDYNTNGTDKALNHYEYDYVC